jgi:hypothetical protein
VWFINKNKLAVYPILRDAPPQLPSSEAFGLGQSHRQALDPLSVIKPAKRGQVLLMQRLGGIVTPLLVAALVEEAVDNLIRNGPLPHQMNALQDLFLVLKNKTKISPPEGWSVD